MGDEELEIPTWSSKKARLSTFAENVQTALYWQKIEKSKFGKASLLLCERELIVAEFERFGVVDCFRRLGWMQNLTKNNDTVDVHVEEIFEWMSTLQRSGSSAVTMVLAGMVHGKTVRLSFRTFESLGRFDTGAIGGAPYEYPSDSILNVEKAEGGQWEEMIRTLFVVPGGVRISSWTLYRKNMKPLPRLLLQIVLANIMPRTSDKHKVRLFEVLVVNALMTGRPVLSARHLIMWNIWEARDRKERLTVPFARLLSQMIKKAGAVPRSERGKRIIHIPFTIASLTKASDWEYEKTRTMHRLFLTSSGRALEAPRSDVDDDDDDDDDAGEGQGAGGDGPQVEPPRLMGYTEGMYGSPYYTHLQTAVANSRPTDFGDWSGSSQAVYDLLAQNVAEDQVHRRSMMYQLHEFRNEDFRHHEAIRHDADYARGWHHTWRPEPVDWTRPDIEPYEETQQLPRYPQATPSHYIPPHPYWAEPQQQQPESSAAAHDPFETRTLSEALCESIFGPRITPREYDG